MTDIDKGFRYMDQLNIDIEKLQQIQDSFSQSARVFIFCVDENGKKLTQLSGNRAEARQILPLVSPEHLAELLGRVMSGSIEDQIVEETKESGVYIACISVKINHTSVINWIIYGIVEDNGQYTTVTSRNSFLKSLDLIRMGSKAMLTDRFEAINAQLESARSHSQEAELSTALKKSQAMTEVLQYLDSDEAIDKIVDSILAVVGRVIDLSNAFVIRCNDDDSADVIGDFTSPDAQTFFSRRIGVDVPEYANNVQRVLAVSSDSKLAQSLKLSMNRYGIEAMICVPIQIQGRNAMTACYIETRRIRSWNREEIKFLGEITRILQAIISRRIQQNSLTSSYVILERILERVGSGILVWDHKRQWPLMMNETLKAQFGITDDTRITESAFLQEYLDKDNKQSPIADINIYDSDRVVRVITSKENGRRYVTNCSCIKWVDGRDVLLCSFFEETL